MTHPFDKHLTKAGSVDHKVHLRAEAVLRADSTAPVEDVRAAALIWLQSLSKVPGCLGAVARPAGQVPFLDAHVHEVTIADIEQQARSDPARSFFLPWEVSWDVSVYALEDGEGPLAEHDSDSEHADEAPSYRQWHLPSAEFHGLWGALHFDAEIKRRLLRYADSALLFAERGVDSNMVAFGRVVLLHGPPGTGKTSLCKALAQKLAIRLQRNYPTAQLIEVCAHSLFSRWFSESGKLVARLFDRIREALQQPALVFVLVDEVESLAAARSAAAGGGEPSDAIRAVNSLLTQLDTLRKYKNCMVLTTSNITGAIDLAFVDRADIKAHIGPPTLQARYEILRSGFEALQAASIVADAARLLPFSAAQRAQQALQAPLSAPTSMQLECDDGAADLGGAAAAAAAAAEDISAALVGVATAAAGFSGRTLRKLPFLAHAGSDFGGGCCGAAQFARALVRAVELESEDRAALGQA